MDLYALLALGAVESNLASVDSTLGGYYAAGLALSASLYVLVNDICAFNDNLALLGRCCNYLTLNALVVTGKNDYGIVWFDIKLCLKTVAVVLKLEGNHAAKKKGEK